MQIGIIGEGKMGREIFNHFFQYYDNLVLKCKNSEDVEKLTASIEKQLRKMRKRGYITDAAYEKKMESFIVSSDLSFLENCDLVIESVFEDRELKKEIFQEIESIVKPECILATNTSSIPLKVIFEKCNKKDRCLGLHFFYPIKITKTVEINKTKFTGQKYIDIVKDLITKVDKSILELKEEANMILSNMLLTMISQIYLIYEEKYLTIEEIDKVLKDNLMTYGLFEIIDSTGINIILQSFDNFMNDRYRNLYTPFYILGKKLMEEAYQGGPGNKGLLDYEKEHPVDLQKIEETELDDYKQNIVLRLQSLLINELAFLIHNGYVKKDEIKEAVQEVLGLSEDPISMFKRVGKEKIMSCLSESYQKKQDPLYQLMDLSSVIN
ncbi:MAG: 3-hydroxyacyl-CoA dehydrogenase family protein [Halanaerobiales bacterium]|nr:3-hydroxyacyl-CoA dehydrogenase family protein [Halanaerobiales bacterium]